MYITKIADPKKRYKNNNKKLNILIVDDDANSRDSLKDIIKVRGHHVVTLDEGLKCVNRCSENIFDMIFMDYHIGDLDGDLVGTDVIRMVRECFDVDTIIYAYTGDDSIDAINNFKKNNMKGAFIKPVDASIINEFFSIIEKNMDDISQLSKLSLKKKNFKYFNKKQNNHKIIAFA